MLDTDFQQLDRDERGQTMAEYAVVLGVITLAISAAIAAISGASAETISRIAGLV